MESKPLFADKPSIIPLTKGYNATSFASTNAELNDFLINDSLNDQDEMISRTYLCCLNKSITGFFTIVADTIEVQAIDEADSIDGYRYRKYPSIKIARLAVDETYERQGFGRFLVLAAIGLALSVSEIIGCRYLTVDSKLESMSFYERLGFRVVEKYRQIDFPKMYIDMQPIVKRMQLEESL
jgi:GNAT superfamily N-acetyltransferase